MGRHNFTPGEVLKAESMNEFVQKADNEILGEYMKDATITMAKMKEFGVPPFFQKNNCGFKDEELSINLPQAEIGYENKFMAFLYYGIDKAEEESVKGVHLLRSFLVYSDKSSTEWRLADDAVHSWAVNYVLDSARGYVKPEIVESYDKSNRLKLNLKTFSSLYDGILIGVYNSQFFVQGWQIS